MTCPYPYLIPLQICLPTHGSKTHTPHNLKHLPHNQYTRSTRNPLTTRIRLNCRMIPLGIPTNPQKTQIIARTWIGLISATTQDLWTRTQSSTYIQLLVAHLGKLQQCGRIYGPQGNKPTLGRHTSPFQITRSGNLRTGWRLAKHHNQKLTRYWQWMM